MANLQKVIKVTQSQYNTLASGGTVGTYTGLNDNYVYFVEDNNTYLPITGGTITGNLTVNGNTTLDNLTVNDNTTFKKNTTYGSDKGIIFTHDVSGELLTTSSINADNYSSEIIYVSDNFQNKPLFANDSGAIIYSEDSDYHESITFNTDALAISRHTGTQNYIINISSHDGKIYYYNGVGRYAYTLPTQSGTLALTSDIPSVSLTTTTGSEAITVGSDTLNVMTRDTAQTISGVKTFTSFPIAKGITLKNNVLNPTGSNFEIANDNGYNGKIRFGGKGLMFTGGSVLPSETNNSQKLGDTNYKWKAVYIDGYLGKQNANYGVSLPDMTNWTANKEIATTDEIPQVKRYI